MSIQTQYNFGRLFGQIPKGEYNQRLDEFCEELDISRTHALRYMRATWSNPANMPIAKLIKAAKFFNLTVDELINHPPKAVPV